MLTLNVESVIRTRILVIVSLVHSHYCPYPSHGGGGGGNWQNTMRKQGSGKALVVKGRSKRNRRGKKKKGNPSLGVVKETLLLLVHNFIILETFSATSEVLVNHNQRFHNTCFLIPQSPIC